MNSCTLFLVFAAAFSVALAMPANSFDMKDVVFEKFNETGKPHKLGLYGFSFNDCGGPKEPVKGNISLSPVNPITLPGSFTGSFNATFGVTLKSPLKAVLVIRKRELVWIEVPCIDNVGSCTYDDVCTMIPKDLKCPPILQAAGIPCHCPFKAGKYKLPPSEIDIGSIPKGIPSFLADGDFQVDVNLYDGATELACAKLAFTLKVNT